jgi:hypothetical protein
LFVWTAIVRRGESEEVWHEPNDVSFLFKPNATLLIIVLSIQGQCLAYAGPAKKKLPSMRHSCLPINILQEIQNDQQEQAIGKTNKAP